MGTGCYASQSASRYTGEVRISIAGHGLSLDLSSATGRAAWILEPQWADPEVQRVHGVYLRNAEHPVQLHVRAHEGKGPFDAVALRACLAAQAWASPPRHEAVTTPGSLVVAAATFAMVGLPWIVREYFVSDGARLANVVLPGPDVAVEASLEAANHLVSTLRFE